MISAVDLYVGAPVTVGEVLSYIGLEAGVKDEQQEWIKRLINQATADLEREAGRLLLSRDLTQRVRADGSIRTIVPEFPPTAVTSMKWRDRYTTTETALDLTGIDFQANWIETPNDAAPSGTMVAIVGTFGYKRGFSSFHDAQIARCQDIVLRLCQIKWQDKEKHIGRALQAATAQGAITWSPTRFPDDLLRAVYPLRRY